MSRVEVEKTINAKLAELGEPPEGMEWAVAVELRGSEYVATEWWAIPPVGFHTSFLKGQE